MLKWFCIAATICLLLLNPQAHPKPQKVSPANKMESTASPHTQWAIPHSTVILDVGHGGIDGGASYGDVLEKDINLAVAKKLYAQLSKQGITVVMNRTSDYALSEENRWSTGRSRHGKDLSHRRQLTEEINSGLLISLHVNASRNTSSHGPVVLHQNTGESVMLAHFIQNELNKQHKTAFLPREGKPFYLLKRVKIPAVIVEMGFISNSNDRQMLTDPKSQEKIAEAIASGIGQFHWTVH